MHIARIDPRSADQTIALLQELQVSLLGIQSRRLHSALVLDGVRGTIDCRVALESDQVKGVVLAAPASYWWSLPIRRWDVALECIGARAQRKRDSATDTPAATPQIALGDPGTIALLEASAPPRRWNAPGDAWKIIFVGTAADARGRGVAAQLYRSVMTDRSLVARIALSNTASIRLHRSVGWRVYRDGDVALALHLRDRA